MRRRLDEAVTWEREVSGGTYEAPRIRHALMRADVDVGVRAVTASMRRQCLTCPNVHWRPTRRGLHSSRVLGRAMGEQQSADRVITALDMAATTRGTVPAGGVLHTDRGTQFTSEKLAAYMRAVQEAVSTGWAGVCWDNTVVESFWATLTIEYHYRRTFTTREQVYSRVATWFENVYNRRRVHASLGGKSPIEHELNQAAWTTALSTNRQQFVHKPKLH